MNRTPLQRIDTEMRPHPAHHGAGRRLVASRGEGVISTAIAVLVIAFIGAAMWVAFSSIWSEAESEITDQVETIGR